MKGLCVLCMPEAFCAFETVRKYVLLNLWVLWEKEISFVRDGTPQRLSWVLSQPEGAFYFSQIYTEEQNTQRFTETSSQPISQNVTANLSWKASVFSVCRRRSVGSKCAPKTSVNSVRSVRERNILRERWNFPATLMGLISTRGCILFLTEEHRRTEHTKATETSSQPITQNVTANLSWKASVFSVCRRRSVSSKRAPKRFC